MLGPVALMLFLVLPGMVAFAQPSLHNFELERLDLNPGAEGSLLVGMGEMLQAGRFRLSAVGHYSHNPLVLYREGVGSTPIVGVRTTMHVAAAYALMNWLQLGVQLPVVALQQGAGPSQTGLLSPQSFGLGTPAVGLRLGLLTQDARGGFDVAVEGVVGLPVGSEAGLGRDEGMRYMPRVMVGRRFGFFRAGLDVGFMARPVGRISELGPEDVQDVGNELRIGAALVSTGRRLRYEFNVRGMIPLSGQAGSAELLPGARYLVNPSLEVFALAGVGIGATPGTPLFRVLAGGSFGDVTPRQGPGETSVKCELGTAVDIVNECPDMDHDRDGVRNGLDKCWDKAGDPARGGCPRTDSDSDGIEDSLDACPTEPGDAARQGCPMRDQDKDGVEDELDSCPAEPGPAESRGCPLKDRDKDGIENDQDECPDEPGPIERKGCPEEDADKDGVPNRVDTCAREPGTESNLGCPEHEVPRLAITPSELKLSNGAKVYFDANTARIQPRSFELLDWVAKVLREHPEIPRVVVGGHTDDRGFPDELRRFSQQRAEAVRRYLIDKGVAAERLVARGYGPDRPIDSNATSTGRENNRRVDFKIMRNGEEGSDAP
ncbi:OmpA family protein [Archangium gephyra]|uniref:OmpA family protein n=1 Tax=Archangium gephyra TaxID=48 RepID=UPI003B78B1F5